MNTDPTPALQVRALSKTYRSGVRALENVDLSVHEGDFFALLGPNGAGKSTLIGIISSLVTKNAGEVSVFGHDLVRDWRDARACIGLVPQEFNFNVWEPVEEILVNQAGYYGIDRALAFERSAYLLKELGLWEKHRVMARELSGGMKRRLMIARAMVHDPRLLILDEPTAGVDIGIRRHMWQFLRERNAAGTTIILTTHYLEEAENLCRNIAIIDRGRIVENTAMTRLLRSLRQETLILDLNVEIDAAPMLDGYQVRRLEPAVLEVDIPQGHGMNRLFTLLEAQGIKVLSMRNKTNRLEELFVNLVERL